MHRARLISWRQSTISVHRDLWTNNDQELIKKDLTFLLKVPSAEMKVIIWETGYQYPQGVKIKLTQKIKRSAFIHQIL